MRFQRGKVAQSAPSVGLITEGGLEPAVEAHLAGLEQRRDDALGRRERRAEAVVALAFLAVAVPLALLHPGPYDLAPTEAGLLVLAYAVASRVTFAAAATGYTAPTQVVFVPLLFAVPPAVAPLAVALGILLGRLPGFLARRKHPDRVLLVPGDAWHAVGPALVLALAGKGEPAWSDWPLYLAALLAQFATDFVVSTLRERLALGTLPTVQPRLLAWVYLVDALLSPVGLLAAFVAADEPLALLLVLPLVALLQLFAGERRTRLEHALELSRTYRGTSLLLSEVLERDHAYTGAHSRDVVELSLAVADELGLDTRQRRNVEFGALLHDVGKIAVPNEIINKSGPLDAEEWRVMRRHTIEGQRLLDRVGGPLHEVGQVVRASHERWDGCGYPDGLADVEIPLEAAIVACCDAVSAMTTDRPYRRAMSPAAAREELRVNAGTQFNPEVARVVGELLEQEAPGEDRGAPFARRERAR